MLDYLRRLCDHMYWADEQVLTRLSAESDPRSLQLFAHMLAAEQVWLTRIQGKDSSHLVIWPTLTIEECRELAEQLRAGYRDYLDSVTESDLESVISYRNSKGVAFQTSRLDMLTQVLLHGSYHRGQIAQTLRGAGIEPVNTDYITWVRLVSDD